ncbi:hypothetical protein PIROE2DRAFT_62622 [Piromyces sp. E2]|nr:hypothetical protein PIROE2DRAFT_62622 [Piromyces sp. E2]|eukprot:OUM61245.1 hypothetical protein PIROE2DRAFT_62622 [Piromyces sp. E2]
MKYKEINIQIKEFLEEFPLKREELKNKIMEQINETNENTNTSNSNREEERIKKLNKFIKYIESENIKFEEWNIYDFDILVYAIENNAYEELIKYIINQYDTLNYTTVITLTKKDIDNIYTTYSESKLNANISPLVEALIKNRFDIAKLLLENGADINYNKELILNDEMPINKEILQFLFEYDFDMNSERIINKLLNMKDKNKKDILKYYLEYTFKKNGEVKINNSYYEIASRNKNMNDILLLYRYDNRDDKFSIIYKIHEYIQNNNSRDYRDISPMMIFYDLLHQNIQDEKIRKMNDIFSNIDQ